MEPEELARIVADPRITNEAFRLIVFVVAHGPGEHEITADELRMVLGCKSDTPVQKARQRAVAAGYIEWKQGGRGHGNVFRYPCSTAQVNDIPMQHGTGKGDVVVGSKKDTPLSPPVELVPIEPDAAALIESERATLGAARKPLISYLHRRVPSQSHEPYTGRILGALSPECMNPAWKDATGMPIPMNRRQAIVADSLNELATADEVKGRVWGQGDFNNLRNKLTGLIRMENAPTVKRATGTDGGPRRTSYRDRPPDAQEYTPTETFTGFNG